MEDFNSQNIFGESIWDKNFNKLKEFINKKNKIPSESSKDKEEQSLGLWCLNQRKNKGYNVLSENRIKALENIKEWFWEKNIEQVWLENFNNLKIFYEENGILPLESSKDNYEKKLGKWCQIQRNNNKKKTLSENDYNSLKNIDENFFKENND